MWYLEPSKTLNEQIKQQAIAHQNSLTKPLGSLGTLEDLAIRLAARQGTKQSQINNIQITVFAADHGIAEEGVSAFPQVVTAEMVKNFANGGAAITVLAKQYNATFNVVDVGVAHPYNHQGVDKKAIAKGTQNFLKQPAMTAEQLQQALSVGKTFAQQAKQEQCQLFIGGEMGITNTTSATAICCALLKQNPNQLTGKGTGIDDKTQKHKAFIIFQAINKHHAKTPQAILQTLGGFEIAALVGAYISCAQQGITVLVDGFISTAAALVAIKLNPTVKEWLEFAHQSDEHGHKAVLSALNVDPLLHLNLRLGEGSGAALCIGLLQSACLLHNNMATFQQAGVSTA